MINPYMINPIEKPNMKPEHVLAEITAGTFDLHPKLPV